MRLIVVALIGASTVLVGCKQSDGAYTLYREMLTPERQRVHVATFDAAASESYNKENCSIARDLFTSQLGVVVRYWCEKGRFRP